MFNIDFKTLLLALLASATIVSCGGDDDDDNNGGGGSTTSNKEVNTNRNTDYTDDAATRIEVPRLKGGVSKFIAYKLANTVNNKKFDNQLVNFCVEWDTQLKSQRWTCYTMTKSNTIKNVSRWYASEGQLQYPFDTKNLTMSDFYTKSSGQDYYSGSGFDHGHLCPSNDRLFSTEVNKQTFYLTNMQPQYKVFNGSDKNHKYKGLWISMENWLNNIALNKMKSNDTLFVCKGGTIDDESHILKRIDGKMIVPKFYFTAVVWKQTASNRYYGIAFWFPHLNEYHGDDPLGNYAVTIDELEAKTGIDFFCNLPDKTESKTENSKPTLIMGL